MSKDSWSPAQYEKFKAQRSQPFFDLMNMLEKTPSPRVIDLGCGTGELTAELHRYLDANETLGVDSSEEMLNKAKAFATANLHFENANIQNWSQPESYDVIFSNAAVQWCTDHKKIFGALKTSLKKNGQLAIQMPMNHDYPTHTLATKMTGEEPWKSKLGVYEKNNLLKAEDYAELLFKLGFKEQKVLLRVYDHELESREGVIEWVKGTLLTYFKSRLSEKDYETFLTNYKQRLFEILPDDKPFFYPFKRVLIWAKL
jgi:trans-aconitate 2-methyltransferase